MRILKNFKGNWVRHGFETLYVIVGILVAFSLNDWNESRKAQNTEISILNELISGLTMDSTTLNDNIERHNLAIQSCDIVLKALNELEEYNDSLALHFAAVNYYTFFASTRGAYESLKSMGFESISNKSLRFEIIDIYDQWYTILLTNQNILVNDIHELKRNFHQDHFDKFLVVIPQAPWYGGEMIPIDFNQLKFNQQYKYHIRSLHAGHSFFNSMNIFVANKVDSLIISCQKEVKRLK
jgi:predicted transposase YbfD/YdcC